MAEPTEGRLLGAVSAQRAEVPADSAAWESNGTANTRVEAILELALLRDSAWILVAGARDGSLSLADARVPRREGHRRARRARARAAAPAARAANRYVRRMARARPSPPRPAPRRARCADSARARFSRWCARIGTRRRSPSAPRLASAAPPSRSNTALCFVPSEKTYRYVAFRRPQLAGSVRTAPSQVEKNWSPGMVAKFTADEAPRSQVPGGSGPST